MSKWKIYHHTKYSLVIDWYASSAIKDCFFDRTRIDLVLLPESPTQLLVQRYFSSLHLSLAQILLQTKTIWLISDFTLWPSFPSNQLQFFCSCCIMRNENLILKFLYCLKYLLLESYCFFVWAGLCQDRQKKLWAFWFALFS